MKYEVHSQIGNKKVYQEIKDEYSLQSIEKTMA